METAPRGQKVFLTDREEQRKQNEYEVRKQKIILEAEQQFESESETKLVKLSAKDIRNLTSG